MKRCKATTKAGHRCLNGQRSGSDFCAAHAKEVSSGGLLATAAGAILGNALMPGLGVVLGGFVGHSLRNSMGTDSMTKKRVFISFDFDEGVADEALDGAVEGVGEHEGARLAI